MSHSVHRHLGIEIASYDAAIRRFIPGYETMLSVAAQEVARARPDLVLDLGAGTGALSQEILLADPTSRVELIDVDSDMLARARTRLAAFGSRTGFTESSFDGPLPRCGAVAASLALHHVRTMDLKRSLYQRIHMALVAHGVFVNADAAMPSAPEAREGAYRAWVEHMEAHGIREREALDHLEQWSHEDTYFALDDELDAMAAVGFEASCVWRKGPIAVVVGRKST